MKICSKCTEGKPLEKFHFKRGKPQAQCKECRAAYMKAHYHKNSAIEKAKRKAWYEENRPKVLAKMKTSRVLRADDINLARRLKKYNLTQQQYEAILAAQNHKCANLKCQSGLTDLDIDHCHTTGQTRGFLCGHCNTALGLVKESKEALEGLIDYLDKYKK